MDIVPHPIPTFTLEQAQDEIRRLSRKLNDQAGQYAEERLRHRQTKDQAEVLHFALGQARLAMQAAGYPAGADIAVVIADLAKKAAQASDRALRLEHAQHRRPLAADTIDCEAPISRRDVTRKFLKGGL